MRPCNAGRAMIVFIFPLKRFKYIEFAIDSNKDRSYLRILTKPKRFHHHLQNMTFQKNKYTLTVHAEDSNRNLISTSAPCEEKATAQTVV